ncbi:hypothetical protein GGR54DRAFT_213225 [Hypoxylon sp. NC1633]|nr:hypothetical protein GGR54DRAFT_213225 [Hypoxylon sp. NC1633]
MSEPRYRYSGRRSPTFNPARASMPVSVGYNPHYSGDPHTIQTARYDTAVPRRATDHKTPATPTTTITTYNVTKDPPQRASNTARRRSSTLDSGGVKPIIVTTNHASRPHGSSSHTTSSTARPTSPSRDPYRSSDETYYAQPASSIRSRSQHRQGHGYTQSATLSNDEFYRLRERVGDNRLRAPAHTSTDYYRYSLPHTSYTSPSHDAGTAVINYENEGYEYTKPSDLARYDLDHDQHDRQQPRRGRRDSNDRPYYRPTVNVVSNDPGRYDNRSRGPPPTSAGLERYNRAAASGIYDRPTVTMPALPPAVPSAPPVEPLRIEAPRDTSDERRIVRPRPVSLYQETPARMSHPDDLYRSHDDNERLHRRRDRDDGYRDDELVARGFGIRTDSLEVPASDRPARSVDRRDYDDRRVRRDIAEREPRRRSDESVDYTRTHDSRKSVDDTVTHVGSSSRDETDSLTRKNSLGGRTRDRFAAGLGAAAAAIGLAPKDALKDVLKDTPKDDDRKVSPRRRELDEDKEAGSSRPADRYKPRERDVVERKPSPREEDVIVERREPRRERAESVSASKDRELERERLRERAHERERERERDQREAERERERERERDRDRERERERERELEPRDREREQDRDRDRRDAEAKLNGSAVVDTRDNSPASEGSATTSRRRGHSAAAFDPRDTKELLSVKAELAAKEGQERRREKSVARDPTPERETVASTSSSRHPIESREESRGREVALTQKEEKQVRVLSPPREKPEHKPIKGILKAPSAKFPEEDNPIREGVAPHKDDKTKKDVPAGARWTKINRKLINPAALEIGKERYEVRDDFVIVLRVLSKEEIQAYATATAQIREAKRKEIEKDQKGERDHDNDRDRSDEEKRTHRRRHEYDDDYEYRRDRDRDDTRERERDRHRRHRRGSDSDEGGRDRRAIEYDGGYTNRHDARHHRSHRDRDYDSVTVNSDERR